tara:strand:- start:1014 stop:1229 length:216 start_codon:yes stop_codon:yes gene_type:complete
MTNENIKIGDLVLVRRTNINWGDLDLKPYLYGIVIDKPANDKQICGYLIIHLENGKITEKRSDKIILMVKG